MPRRRTAAIDSPTPPTIAGDDTTTSPELPSTTPAPLNWGELPPDVEAVLSTHSERERQPPPASPPQASAASTMLATIPSMTVEEILAHLDEHGNSSTLKTYKVEQTRFLTWVSNCIQYPPLTRHIVTEDKLLVYLHTQVNGRIKKRKRGDAVGSTVGNSNKNGSWFHTCVGIQTFKNAVSAVVDLWTKQRNLRINDHKSPRGPLVKKYLEHIKKREFQKSRDEFKDRGVGTLADGYSTHEEFSRLACSFFDESYQADVGLRFRAMLLMSHYGLLRGQNARDMEFADLQLHDIPNPGPQKVFALYSVLCNGKTNQVNRIEYAAMIRYVSSIVSDVIIFVVPKTLPFVLSEQ
jgi:hypothetical protein